MKWAVDYIIDNIVILENIETLERKEVDITLLPTGISDGSMVIYRDNKYILDDKEMDRRNLIEEKFRRLRDNS